MRAPPTAGHGAPEAAGAGKTRTVLWDLDATLLTTGRAGVFALEDAAEEAGGDRPDLAGLKTDGLTDGQVAGLALQECGVEPSVKAVARFLRVYERRLPERLHLRRGGVLPGVHEVLGDLRRRQVLSLLLTGNTRAGATAKLAHYGLDGYFEDGGFCQGTEPRDAIAARALERARHRLDSLRPEDVVVVGDTPYDIRCAKAIGARPVGVATGVYTPAQLEQEGAWLVLARLPEPSHFAELLG